MSGAETIVGNSNPEIKGISADSRLIKPGFLFAALPGHKKDGRRFIADAIARGASAILAAKGSKPPSGAINLPLITSTDPRQSLAIFASRFYPIQPNISVAVTGTNGKTSVAWFTKRLWSALGYKAASIGTLGVDTGKNTLSSVGGLTTADPVTLHQTLQSLAISNINAVILEASSHGLDQRRLDGVRLRAGAFTNLSRDHLDYHKNMSSYRAAKRRLFDRLLPDGTTAVLHSDTKEYEEWKTISRNRGLEIISYGKTGADLKLINTKPNGQGQKLTVKIMNRIHEISVPIAGSFQAENILCAIGLVLACGEDTEKVVAAASKLTTPIGRMELVGTLENNASIYVDYAHTPAALEAALNALRKHTQNKLHLIFGCGGNRDTGKREEMGKIADKLADEIIISDDNPRNEDSKSIRSQIATRCPHAIDIGDRKEAINTAIQRLSSGDTLIIAGKGHESDQIVGNTISKCNDRDIVQAALYQVRGKI